MTGPKCPLLLVSRVIYRNFRRPEFVLTCMSVGHYISESRATKIAFMRQRRLVGTRLPHRKSRGERYENAHHGFVIFSRGFGVYAAFDACSASQASISSSCSPDRCR